MTWYEILTAIVSSGAFRGTVSGIITAAIVDIGAFRGWKDWNDALTYNWGVASFRWFQGAVIGAISGAGLASFD